MRWTSGLSARWPARLRDLDELGNRWKWGGSIRSTDDIGDPIVGDRRSVGMEHIDFEKFVDAHGHELLATARRFSGSSVDADDVYQATLEALLTKAPSDNDANLLAWAKTVGRNYALGEHRRLGRREEQPYEDEVFAQPGSDPATTAESSEEANALSHAIRRLRPDHARCLLLRSEDLPYPEICRITGFSYAKVNRCLSEGRKSLHESFIKIESGVECERIAGALSMYADGVAEPDRASDVESHLATCMRCQVRLREYRDSARKVAAAFPIGLVFESDPAILERLTLPFRRIGESAQNALAGAQEQVAARFVALQQFSEIGTVKQLAVVAGVSASMVATGAGVEKLVSDESTGRPVTTPSESIVTEPTAPTPAVSTDKPNNVSDEKPKDDVPKKASAADVERPDSGSVDETTRASAPEEIGTSAPSADAFEAPSGSESDGSQGTSSDFPDIAP